MKPQKIALSFLLVPFGAGMLSVAASTAMAQTGPNPCDPKGVLRPGTLVYSPNLDIANGGVCWLADANLAGSAVMRAAFGVSGINPNGTMDFPTAQNWVAALNNGAGLLGHNDWQLPVTPPNDTTCAANGPGPVSFGPGCTGSAMGRIYPGSYPDSVAPGFGVPVTPFFQDLKLSYYWTQAPDPNGGQKVFAFSNGKPGGVTTTFPYYYVLPMVPHAIDDAPVCLTRTGVLPYTKGPAAFQAVYDCATYYTWVADGNLAAQNTFGISGDVKFTSNKGTILKVPVIDRGAMLFATANQMINALNALKINGINGYLGSQEWQLPPDPTYLEGFAMDLGLLTSSLGLTSADSRLKFTGSAGPFQNLQPFYYWGCQQDQPGLIESPCTTPALPSGSQQQMQWTFNFDDGFTGTAETSQPFFVMVYFPVPLGQQCSNPMQCCLLAGGFWSGGHCN